MDQTVDVVDVESGDLPRMCRVEERLRDDVCGRELDVPVFHLLSVIVQRLHTRGLNRDAIGQVVFSVWHGRSKIVELDALGDQQVADQTRRIILWALMELFNLVKNVDDTPTVAWMLMQVFIDGYEGVEVASVA